MLPRRAVAAALAFSGCASAQVVIEATVSSVQPVISRDADGFSVCGIRTTVFVERTPPRAEIYDFSLQYSVGAVSGLMKIGKNAADLSKPTAAPKAVQPAPVSVWISRELDGKPLVLKVLFDSPESPGYVMGSVDAVRGFETMMAMATGDRMHLVARYKSEPYDSVVSYQVGLEQRELALLQACTTQLIERWKKQAVSDASH